MAFEIPYLCTWQIGYTLGLIYLLSPLPSVTLKTVAKCYKISTNTIHCIIILLLGFLLLFLFCFIFFFPCQINKACKVAVLFCLFSLYILIQSFSVVSTGSRIPSFLLVHDSNLLYIVTDHNKYDSQVSGEIK